MKRDAFSQFHPVVNFLFFLSAIGFGMVIQHPAYVAAGLVCAVSYTVALKGIGGLKLLLGMFPVVALIALMNPLFNTYGRTVLFYVIGRPYSLEAVCYGIMLGMMFLLMMLWFSCYNVVLTSDKFVCLFGSLIPSLSLLLVMVLRLIPGFVGNAKQILAARSSIGKGVGAGSSHREKVISGASILSALTDWALEGSIVTADSMRSRGYGCARRTSFRIYRMGLRDWLLLGVELVLGGVLLAAVVLGKTKAEFIPTLSIPPISWVYWVYWVFLLIPTVLHGKEALQWRIIRWKI